MRLEFLAAALRCAVRDRWMAWSAARRRDHLNPVICLSRFLTPVGVLSASCQSCARPHPAPGGAELRGALRVSVLVPGEFADEDRIGACLRAAIFLRVGETADRGRQDRKKQRAKTVKTVFMYPLHRGRRTALGVAYVGHAPVPDSKPEPAPGPEPDRYPPERRVPVPPELTGTLLGTQGRQAGGDMSLPPGITETELSTQAFGKCRAMRNVARIQDLGDTIDRLRLGKRVPDLVLNILARNRSAAEIKCPASLEGLGQIQPDAR